MSDKIAPNCFIFDIDGTLANGRHREHHIVRIDSKPKDWDAYFAALGEDLPYYHMWILTRVLGRHYSIVYVTARNEAQREATVIWLRKQNFPPGRLYCRQDNDRRDDSIIKIELLAQIRADGYEPYMVFDDRDRVVAAWRAAGVPCAQVAEGDF